MNNYIFCTKEKDFKKKIKIHYALHYTKYIINNFLKFMFSLSNLKIVVEQFKYTMNIYNDRVAAIYFPQSNNIFINLEKIPLQKINKVIEHEDIHKAIYSINTNEKQRTNQDFIIQKIIGNWKNV